MIYNNIQFSELGVEAQISIFPISNGVEESHVILNYVGNEIEFVSQANALDKALETLRRDNLGHSYNAVFKRYFLSDSANQFSHLKISDECIIIQSAERKGNENE